MIEPRQPPHTFELSPTAERNMAALPRKIAEVCANHIVFRLIYNPERLSKVLTDPPMEGSRSTIPLTGYRIVFDLYEDRRHIEVLRIGPRGKIYRP